MTEFWCIGVKGDGTHAVAMDYFTDEYFLIDKAENGKRALYFKNKETAQKYIDKNLDPNKFVPEWLLTVDYLVCDECGLPLSIMWNQELEDKSREMVCHCYNFACGKDYTIITKDGELVSKERFFFG